MKAILGIQTPANGISTAFLLRHGLLVRWRQRQSSRARSSNISILQLVEELPKRNKLNLLWVIRQQTVMRLLLSLTDLLLHTVGRVNGFQRLWEHSRVSN